MARDLFHAIVSDGLLTSDVEALTSPSNAATTSIATIRDSLVSAIALLTPTVSTAAARASTKFVFVSKQQYADFTTWCDDNDQACFRHYAIEFDAWEPVSAFDTTNQRRVVDLRLTIAYPNQFALYGNDNAFDQADVIEADLTRLLSTIGIKGKSSYPTAAVPVAEEASIQEGESVKFGVISVQVEYYYSTP